MPDDLVGCCFRPLSCGRSNRYITVFCKVSTRKVQRQGNVNTTYRAIIHYFNLFVVRMCGTEHDVVVETRDQRQDRTTCPMSFFYNCS